MEDQYPKWYLYRRIVKAKLFIDRFYADRIDLGNIADEAHFSKYHFIRLFKSVYGKTPNQYLAGVRIDRAKHLLRSGTSVRQACFSVGYESVSTFSSLFTATVGVTPSQYLHDCHDKKQQQASRPLDFVPGCYAFMHGWTGNSNIEEGTM
jgi:AraC-like DNA-binding protein